VQLKDVTESRGKALSRALAEALLAFGRSMEAAQLIFGNVKSPKCLCCLAKMTFNKSHFNMRMVNRGHFVNIKIFSGNGTVGGREQEHEGGNTARLLAPPMVLCLRTRY